MGSFQWDAYKRHQHVSPYGEGYNPGFRFGMKLYNNRGAGSNGMDGDNHHMGLTSIEGGSDHETRPRNVYVNYIIKVI